MSCATPSTPLPPLRVTRGARRAWLFSVSTQTGSTKAPADITGAKIWFTVKNRVEDVAPIISKRNSVAGGVDNQILIVIPTSGVPTRFKVVLDPADTAGLDPAAAFWCDAWVQLQGGPPLDREQVMRNRQLIIDPAVTTVF